MQRVEYYQEDSRYTLVVDGRLKLSTSSKRVSDHWYHAALEHTSSSREPWNVTISEAWDHSSRFKHSKRASDKE